MTPPLTVGLVRLSQIVGPPAPAPPAAVVAAVAAGPVRLPLVRPVGGEWVRGRWAGVEGFRIVTGGAVVAAARAAGLKEILCLVRPMTDDEAAEAVRNDLLLTVPPRRPRPAPPPAEPNLFSGIP